MRKIYVIIVAAGRGSRMGGELPKQYFPLGSKSVLYHTVSAFLAHGQITGIRVVIHQDDLALYEESIKGLELLEPVYGGKTRQESVRLGLESLKGVAPDQVLIHDAARPFVSRELISSVIENIKQAQGVIAALPVVDTLKKVNENLCETTIDRSCLWRAQTPQGFQYEEILKCHNDLSGDERTDDAALFEAQGLQVMCVTGNENNFKITTQEDYRKAQKKMTGAYETRLGIGFDVHRFEAGDHLTLCGEKIKYNMGLKGHSDADVAMHALTDALLGAISAGDIGTHFPPSDDKWRGVASHVFLQKAVDLIKEKSGEIINVDVTIICEAPKIGPHRDNMIENLSRIMNLSKDRISIKATTTEKLGFTGRKEGIAAQAGCSVRLPACL